MGWRRPLIVFILASLVVDLAYILGAVDVVDTDKYFLGVWWVPWTYLEAAFSPYSPDYMGILKFNYHPSEPIVMLVYTITGLAGIHATLVIPFLLHLSLMVGMYTLLSRLVDREPVRILGSLAYGLNPVASAYYVATPIAFLPALLPVMVAFIIDLAMGQSRRACFKAGLAAGFTVSMHYSFAPLAAGMAGVAGLYALAYSPDRRRALKTLILAALVALAAMAPTLIHLSIVHFVGPDKQLNYLSQGLDPESVANDIRYCYSINATGVVSLTWDPCHKQTRTTYNDNPLGLLHIPLALATLSLAALIPRLRGPKLLAGAAWASTVLAASYASILFIHSLGPAFSGNILVVALRSPIKLRLAAELALITGSTILIGLLLSSRRRLLGLALAWILVLSMAGIMAPYIADTVSMETYNPANPALVRLYEEGALEPGVRGLIVPYTHEAMLHSPPEMRLLPLSPRPPVVGYIDSSYRAGTLPYALEALGAGRIVVLDQGPGERSFYDVALSQGVDPSRVVDMLVSSGVYRLAGAGDGFWVFTGRGGLLDSYGEVFVVPRPSMVWLSAYLLNTTGYIPTISQSPGLMGYLSPDRAYMVSTIDLGPSSGDYTRVYGGHLFVYTTPVDGWNAPRLGASKVVSVSGGMRVEVARGVEMLVSVPPAHYRLEAVDSSGATVLIVESGSSGITCTTPGGTVEGSWGQLGLSYSGGKVNVGVGGLSCAAEASGVLRVYLEAVDDGVRVVASGRVYGPVYHAVAVDGWRVLVYRVAYNSLYRLAGVEAGGGEPILVDGFGNAWFYRGGEPVVVEPLSRLYLAVGAVTWLLFYPLAAIVAVGRVKGLNRVLAHRRG
ncbi:MAG: hypothetical protein GSR84_06385 [Desulfurococcales archaeon]|nr:hypothetical protein [Desulfurococcales archaeon]